METEFVNQTPTTETPEQTPAEAQPQFVTSEQLTALGDKLSGDMKAMLGRVPHIVEQQVQSFAPKAPEPVAEEKGTIDPKAEVQRILNDERAQLAKEKQALGKQRIRGSIEKALTENGADPLRIKMAADSLMMRNADGMTIESNELGESSIVYKESEFAEPVLVNDFVKTFLSGSEGASILQAKSAPSLHNVPNGKGPVAGEIVKMTRAEAATADPKLLMSGRVQFTD